jgi:LEA14-like dessication related protein
MNQVLNFQKPSAKMAGLGFQDAGTETATLLFDIEIDNPYSADLPLANLDYNLSTSNKPFLSGDADLQTTIPKNSRKTVSLPVKINYMDMLKALQNVKPGAEIPYKADIGLSVDTPVTGSMRLPLKKEGKLTLPTLSDVNWNRVLDVINSN